jgi:hypothetical protein
MGRAKYVYLVMDGAIWLWDLAEDRFAQALKTLDFHHARDHLQISLKERYWFKNRRRFASRKIAVRQLEGG